MILNFTGDVVLADLFEKYRTGIGTRLLKRTFDPFDHCREYFNLGDVNIINLESVLANSSSRKPPWSEIMRGTPASISLLKKNRIHAVNLANNHTLDHGLEAYQEMLHLLDEAGIVHFGGPRDVFQELPASVICQNHKISFLGYYIEESLPPLKRDQLIGRIITNIERIRENKGILVLSLHWGSEYSNKPFSWMIQSGKKFIESGVDIIYGHHSHTYQGVTMYNNGIFAPGLGNFIFEDCIIKNRRSSLLQVEYSQTGFKFKTVPLFINKEGRPSDSVPCKKYIDSLNIQLGEVMNKPLTDLYNWDQDAEKQVYSGHLKNRLKLRFKILTHPIRFYPFIIHR